MTDNGGIDRDEIIDNECLRLEHHQIAVERHHRRLKNLEEKIWARNKFFDLLYNDQIPAAEVANFLDGNRFSYTSFLLDVRQIEEMRQWRRDTIRFTRFEAADVVYLLMKALEQLRPSAHDEAWDASLIIGTDGNYRPHASIRVIAEQSFLILLSGSMLMDLIPVAFTVYDIITSIRQSRPAETLDFEAILASDLFIEEYNQSEQKLQFPYLLAQLSLGEKFRFASAFYHFNKNPNNYIGFHQLCICFLLAHEIGHLINGDLHGGEPQLLSRMLYTIYDPESPHCHIKHLGSAALKSFWDKFGDNHSREFAADAFAFLITEEVASATFNNRLPGIAASALVLSVISWLDRVNCWIDEAIDPVELLGVGPYNREPGLVDVKLPRTSHPWGRTRLSLLAHHIQLRQLLNPNVDLGDSDKTDSLIINNIIKLFRETTAPAMLITTPVVILPGELMSSIQGENVITVYWKDPQNLTDGDRFEHPKQDFFGVQSLLERLVK